MDTGNGSWCHNWTLHTGQGLATDNEKTAWNRQNNWVLMLDDTEFTTVLSEEKERRRPSWPLQFLAGRSSSDGSIRKENSHRALQSQWVEYIRQNSRGLRGKYRAPQKETPEICTGSPTVFGWTSSCMCIQQDSSPPRPRPNIKWEGSCKLNNLGDHIQLEGFWPTQLEEWLVEHLGRSV